MESSNCNSSRGQEQLRRRVFQVLKAMQVPHGPTAAREGEVAQDRGVQRLLHGRALMASPGCILSKALADDSRFEVVEDPRHGIMIRLANESHPQDAVMHAKVKQSPIQISVLFCQDSYAAILDKPAGTTTEDLIQQFQLQLEDGQGQGPLQSVSRLDAPTSGALVVPLSPSAAEDLKDRFATRSVTKAYVALVLGTISEQGEINAKLRSFQTVDRYRAVVHPYGKDALTLFQRLAVLPGDEQCESYSLVLAWPLTGRMHQIRAHFAHLGFPLAGDARYGPRRTATPTSCLGARLFLHAAYVFVSASLTAVSPLKADLLEPLKDTGGFG
eukprot:Skav228377  [mRNA]  locus=scaffold1981:317414:320813:+ [translate_table: standard]